MIATIINSISTFASTYLSVISLIGIVIGLVLLIFLAYKGHSIVWVAPVCAAVVAIFGGLDILDSYLGFQTKDGTAGYMIGTAEYIMKWFPAFFLGAVYGKIMDMTGSARSLANKIVSLIGPKFALLAVVLPCLLMTYGGISLFVVVFVIYPMGYAIYREADIPRTLLPGAIAFGAFCITMTAIPGTPQVQNLIPMEYYGTTAMAAPLMGIVGAILIAVPGYIYLDWRIRSSRKKGLHFEEDPKHKDLTGDLKLSKWHWLCGLIPLIVVVLMLNALPIILKNANIVDWTTQQAMHKPIVVALLGGIIVTCLMNMRNMKVIFPAISAGADGSITAIMNTACAVGFGSVVKLVPGFELLKAAMLKMPGSILFSEAVAVNVLAGATGSASGGMSIALKALGPDYLATGVNPEYLHRIASLASGGLDTLPHNGAVLTLLAVSNCKHKESYMDICITSCIIPVVVSLVLALVWGLFI